MPSSTKPERRHQHISGPVWSVRSVDLTQRSLDGPGARDHAHDRSSLTDGGRERGEMTGVVETPGMVDTAERFFEACESGGGWEKCQEYCHPNATFEAQAAALEGIDSVQA